MTIVHYPEWVLRKVLRIAKETGARVEVSQAGVVRIFGRLHLPNDDREKKD
jgi:hypothetical protein